jgi:hypothetical protein
MTASQYFQHLHGDSPFLSKDAIIAFSESYAQHRFDTYRNNKDVFNTEQWLNQEQLKRKVNDLKKNP